MQKYDLWLEPAPQVFGPGKNHVKVNEAVGGRKRKVRIQLRDAFHNTGNGALNAEGKRPSLQVQARVLQLVPKLSGRQVADIHQVADRQWSGRAGLGEDAALSKFCKGFFNR